MWTNVVWNTTEPLKPCGGVHVTETLDLSVRLLCVAPDCLKRNRGSPYKKKGTSIKKLTATVPLQFNVRPSLTPLKVPTGPATLPERASTKNPTDIARKSVSAYRFDWLGQQRLSRQFDLPRNVSVPLRISSTLLPASMEFCRTNKPR